MMKKKIALMLTTVMSLSLIFGTTVSASNGEESPQKQLVAQQVQADPVPTPVIIDADMSTDTDDLVAVRICQQYANEGLITLDGLLLSAENDKHEGASAACGILDAYGFPNTIVGTSTSPNIETNLPYWGWLSSQKKTAHSTDTAVRQYRRLLANNQGKKYGILIVGYYDNIYNLMKSGPDDISPETGIQLIAEHVAFFDVCGAGKGNQGDAKQYTGFENNTCFYNSSYTAASQFYKGMGLLKVPIYQYCGERYLAAVCNVGGRDQLSDGDVVYKAFNGFGRYDGGPGYDAIAAWMLLPIISNQAMAYGITPESYHVEATSNAATRFTSVPCELDQCNVYMMDFCWSGKTYKTYIDDAY